MRQRRHRTPRKPKPQAEYRQRRPKIRFNFKEAAFRLLIALFLLVDLALVFFAVRSCTGRKAAVVSRTVSTNVKTDTTAVLKPRSDAETVPGILQIEVLNGCGVPRIADRFTAYLRKNNFDVVKTGNYETFGVSKTIVIDRKGKLENAVRIAKAMGLPRERALQEQSDAFLVDATVILGSDFRQLPCWKKMEKSNVRTGF